MAEPLTLETLAARTGIEARTLRSWVAEGLLAPPLNGGRGARYPAANLDRALAIRALKEGHGLSLVAIGRHLLMASDEQIRAWAGEAPAASVPPGSARDDLRAIGARAVPPPAPRAGMAPRLPGTTGAGQVEQLVLALERLLGAPAQRRAGGTVWTRIAVTADLELSVRGDLSPPKRRLFEQLADQMRAILTGGLTP